jgi:SWIM zinc finger
MSSTRSLPDASTDSRPSPTTRAESALRLFEDRGSLIRSVAADTFEVPSCGFRGKRYAVRYGGGDESCTCPDYKFGGHTCKHLLCVGIMHATKRGGVKEVRIPAAVAGDPFEAASKRRGCPACFGGYLTISVEEDGQERGEAVPCRRCHADDEEGWRDDGE